MPKPAPLKYKLKKSLGQHFLHDEQVCQNIVAELTVNEDMKLLEVGPGAGAITKYLIEIPNIDFKAVEVDEEKVNYLLASYPILKDKIVHQDFLQSPCPFESNFSLIGNFPYNISSQILFKVMEWEPKVDQVIGMFQKEVAQRIASKEGSKVYGILSVLIQTFFTVEYMFDVSEKCFTPPPKVKSGVIKLVNIHNPHSIDNAKKYTKMIKAAFSQRRKTLRNALKPLLQPEQLADEVFNKRAEQLSVPEFVNLYNTYFR